MTEKFVNLAADNISSEHLCCAISDKKHQYGVSTKKDWLRDRISEGHIFRKLNQKGKVFIEYAPLETAWVPVVGKNYLYIYCLWVSGSFKNKGYGRELLQYCINDAKRKEKVGVCIISSKKKKPFLSDRKFMQKFGFDTVDTIDNDYELMALSFDGSKPQFSKNVKKQSTNREILTIYYGLQCPYIPNCIEQIKTYCNQHNIPIEFIKVDTLDKAKEMPCVFNNWAVFYKGQFETVHLLNESYLKKMLDKK